jgi:hypothetical protein
MNHDDDQLLDDRVRDVPVPAGIAGRVMPQALFDDAAIDRLLVRVALPAGLHDRVREATAAMREGATLSLPGGSRSSRRAGPSGRGGGRPESSWPRIRLWPAAMDLLADGGTVAVALSIVALMFFAGTELSRRLAAPAAAPQRVAVRGPLQQRPESTGGATESIGGAAESIGGAARVGRSRPQDRDGVGTEEAAPKGSDVANGIPSPSVAAKPAADAFSPAPPPVVGQGGSVEVRAAPAASVLAGGDRGIARAGIRTVPLLPGGRQVPRVRGYDIAFEMAHGESPFVDPSIASALAVDCPPLSLRTDSFDSLIETVRRDRGRPTGRRLRRGGTPSVRTEDILAAVPISLSDTAWSRAGMGPGPGLMINAVHSLRPTPGSLFVEVCAAAPPLPVAATAAEPASLDVMLVLDQSAGPFAALSWQWLCRGLGRVARQMRPGDRVSLVVCGEQPRLVALRADAPTLASLLPELMREPSAIFADFDAAFRLVEAVGRREGRAGRVVAVVHADTMERCRREGRAALSSWQADMAAADTLSASSTTEFMLIDQETQPAAETAARTAPVAGERIAADPIAICRGLVERVFGCSTAVATDCRLEVTFDPRHVDSYRLVGHRQSAADTLANSSPLGIDLHAGETTRVVYEVIRRAGETGPLRQGIVSASLTWAPAEPVADGPPRSGALKKALADGGAAADLGVGLPSPHGCELLLAVALGELAGASVHAEPWRQSAAEIAAIAAGWQARGDVTPIGSQLIECLAHQGIIPDAAGR